VETPRPPTGGPALPRWPPGQPAKLLLLGPLHC